MASSASSSLDPSLVTLLGEELYTADGKVATSEALNGVDFVMLYVGALSTPSFTSKLAAYWSKHHTDKSFATVFVSVDNKAADFASAFAGMPWNLALPFGAKDRLGAIARRFKITGAPTVVILDAVSGNEITSDAAGAINADVSTRRRGREAVWSTVTPCSSLCPSLRALFHHFISHPLFSPLHPSAARRH